MGLILLNNLFKELNSNKVKYCHWKSNLAIEKSLNAETDLDIFVIDKDKFISIITKYGFKKGDPPIERDNNETDHYFGLDEYTGKIIHIHIYYKLITGLDYIKSYYIPLELELEKNLKLYKNIIYISNEDIEIILLTIRLFLKKKINLISGKLDSDIFKEFNYLKKNISNYDNIKDIIFNNDSIPNEILLFIKNPKTKELRRINKAIFKLLKDYKKYNSFYEFIKFYTGKISSIPYFINKNHNRFSLKSKKNIFAFVGCPGSGKTTTTTALDKWLKKYELKSNRIYLGLSEKPLFEKVPLYFFIIYNVVIYRFVSKISSNKIFLKPFNYLYDIFISLRWIGAMYSRYLYLKKAINLSSKGEIVIFDRYPIKDIWENMDLPMEGPSINYYFKNKNSKLINYLIKIETNIAYKIYSNREVVKFILKVDSQEAIRRGRRKDAVLLSNLAVNKIKKNIGIHLDKNLNFEERLLVIKKELWKFL